MNDNPAIPVDASIVTGVSNVEKGSWIEQSEQMVKKCSWSCGVPKTINFEMFKPGLFG